MSFKIKMMENMMPSMAKNLSFEELEQIMEKMMPVMMKDLSFEQKMKLMKKMMPIMMDDINEEQMPIIMEQMMPVMKKNIDEKGIDSIDMIEKMMPIFFKTMLKGKSEKQKKNFYKKIETILKKEL